MAKTFSALIFWELKGYSDYIYMLGKSNTPSNNFISLVYSELFEQTASTLLFQLDTVWWLPNLEHKETPESKEMENVILQVNAGIWKEFQT